MNVTQASNLLLAGRQLTSEPPVDLVKDSATPAAIVQQHLPAADAPPVPEPYPLDRAFHAMLARFTGGITPLALSLAYLDWSSHLAAAPQRQVEMSRNVVRDMGQFMEAAAHATS